MDAPLPCDNRAPDGPGLPPRWTEGDKDSIGTAYSTSSRIWFTVARGLVTEVYYPTVDRPQVRDLQYVVTDGESFFHDERQMEVEVDPLAEHALDIRLTTRDPEGRYRIIKEIITDPHEATLLIQTKFEPADEWRGRLKLFVLCSPHLQVGGWNNNGRVMTISDHRLLVAHKEWTWLALTTSTGFSRCSCGYVGVNDGWTDLEDNFQMDYEFDCAPNGNIALFGEVDLAQGHAFTLALTLGNTLHNTTSTLFQSLSIPFGDHLGRYREQWERACSDIATLGEASGDSGHLYRRSQSVLLAHEDKSYPGAFIASLSIPWGQVKGDEQGLGGYHLVWPRDLVQITTGLLATNNTDSALRALIYLAMAQEPDGGFCQNLWVNGEPFWRGTQLDEVASAILLAWHLHRVDALKQFDPVPMVRDAAAFLIREGPATPQERWEEAAGYSPSTLAACIAALTCAASMLRGRVDDATADFIQEYADFLEAHVERWTVTTEGALHPDISRHYIRINPANPDGPHPNENPNEGTITIPNRPPDAQSQFPAKEIVDAGFLHLVRFGIRAADDPLIKDSLRVVDAVLKVETPHGPSWHRYNHDGYGQQPDGSAFEEWGVGRAWPLLTGERGHYELAAGNDVTTFIRALESFASADGLLPEQVWDKEEQPEPWLALGRPTGSAMPLAWAHAEYIKLLRSVADGQVFDFLPDVAKRYQSGQRERLLEVWKPNRQIQAIAADHDLRIQRPQPFCLRWTADRWQTEEDIEATETSLGISFADVPLPEGEGEAVEFTFYYPESDRWEEQNYQVTVQTKESR